MSSCQDCAHYNESAGECRRYPPQWFSALDAADDIPTVMCRWPAIETVSCCGEYRVRVDRQLDLDPPDPSLSACLHEACQPLRGSDLRLVIRGNVPGYGWEAAYLGGNGLVAQSRAHLLRDALAGASVELRRELATGK